MAFDHEIAALTIFCEASSATSDERLAIAFVILNRKKQGFAKTVAGVCLKHMQFSEWNGDVADNKNLMRGAEVNTDHPMIQDSLHAFIIAESGLVADLTKGATHYHDKTIEPPYWTKDATLTIETKSFKFYKDVK